MLSEVLLVDVVTENLTADFHSMASQNAQSKHLILNHCQVHFLFLALWFLTQCCLRSPQLLSAFHLLPTSDSRNLFLLQFQQQAWKGNRLQIFVPDDLATLSVPKRKYLCQVLLTAIKVSPIL